MRRIGRIAGLLLVVGLALAGVRRADAATISGPGTSTTGSFTLTWPAGYNLRAIHGTWQYAAAPVTSYTFSDLPSGTYVFGLFLCETQTEPGAPDVTLCFLDAGSTKTVTVTRATEAAIDTSTTQAGTTAYSSGVSLRGSAQVEVPLRVLPGVNALAPALALRFDSARKGDVTDKYSMDDTLGYGWHLTGASVINRCRVGQAGDPAPVLDDSERLCLDGEPLVLASGASYWAADAVYRTEAQTGVRVLARSTAGLGAWYEAQYPDGRVARYGDTAQSQVVASGQYSTQVPTGYLGANPVYAWALRQVSNGLGDTLLYDYARFDPYGMLQLTEISYAGARVEFRYGARADLAEVLLGSAARQGKLWRQSYLHTVRVLRGTTPVREYRLDSNADADGRVRLESIQECGYDEAGTVVSCLRPLGVGWTAIAGGASPIAVTSLADGMGAQTAFAYAAVSSGSNPATYTEAPFGPPVPPADTVARDALVVTQVERSDGLSGAGRQSTRYAYKGSAWASAANRGLIGFYERRETDEQRGTRTYTQTRLDYPYLGAVSAQRLFTGVYGTGGVTELAREERAYASKVSGATRLTYMSRHTVWSLEGGSTVGATETVTTPCFRALAGNTCPGSGAEGEFPTQWVDVATAGNAIDDPAFTPAVWGEVPDRTVSAVKHTETRTVNLANTASPWVVGNPVASTVTDTEGADSRTVTTTAAYLTGTSIPVVETAFPGHATLERSRTRTFTGNNLTSETVAGAGLASRGTTWGAAYVDDRYPPTVTNALGQTVTIGATGYDLRFGLPGQVTDPDGRVRTRTFDAFGRLLTDTLPDGTSTSTTYGRCDLVDCSAVTGAVPALKITTTVMNGATQVAPASNRYLDVRGREVLVETEALGAATLSRVRTVYDAAGRVRYVSRPYASAEAPPLCASAADAAAGNCTWFTYDALDRVIGTTRPDGGSTATTSTGAAGTATVTRTETVVQPGAATVSRAKRAEFDVLGRVTRVTDAHGTPSAVATEYAYTAHGDLAEVKVGGVQVAQMQYDLARNRTQISEPNSGVTALEPDALGQVTRTTDVRGFVTTLGYDLLGRLTTRTDLSGTAYATVNAWEWDAANATGALSRRYTYWSGDPGTRYFDEAWTYRVADGKPTQVNTAINVPGVLTDSFTRTLSYDGARRPSQVSYPKSAGAVVRAYSAQGYPTRLQTTAGAVLQEAKTADAFGNVTRTEYSANAFATERGHDPATGRLLQVRTGVAATPESIQDLEYTWRSNGTLAGRKDRKGTAATGDDVADAFAYDALERVTQQSTGGAVDRTLDFGFSGIGNLTTKDSNVAGDLDVTGYAYASAGQPQRLTQVSIGGVAQALVYDAAGNLTRYDAATGDDTFLGYDGQGRVTRITLGASADTTTPKAREEFWYDPDGRRYLGRESWNDAGTQKSVSTVYLGDYEEARAAQGGTRTVQRIQASEAVRRVRRLDAQGAVINAAWQYVHRDHLGSVDVVTNASGGIINGLKTSFDPFGGLRAGSWASDQTPAERTTLLANEQEQYARGFTDHEMLHRTGFVHMNGRVYDPRIGRFVSPDPVVADPYSSQGYNRYAYVANSPLSFTDPSGYEAGPTTRHVCRDTCYQSWSQAVDQRIRDAGRRLGYDGDLFLDAAAVFQETGSLEAATELLGLSRDGARLGYVETAQWGTDGSGLESLTVTARVVANGRITFALGGGLQVASLFDDLPNLGAPAGEPFVPDELLPVTARGMLSGKRVLDPTSGLVTYTSPPDYYRIPAPNGGGTLLVPPGYVAGTTQNIIRIQPYGTGSSQKYSYVAGYFIVYNKQGAAISIYSGQPFRASAAQVHNHYRLITPPMNLLIPDFLGP